MTRVAPPLAASIATIVALSLGACAGETREDLGASRAAIIGGAIDSGDLAVVRMPSSNCSGTLVGARAVLTAAHCDVAAGDPVSFSDGTTIAALAFHAHPSWDPARAHDDVAIVVLARASSVAPLPLFAGTFDDALVGARVRIVGYGDAGEAGAAGTKRTGFTTVASFDDTTFTDSATPSASCAGDSGGPALLTVDGVERVAGVTSRGDDSCRAFGVKTRVDAFKASFLAPAIAATVPGAIAVGGACDANDECASGACVVAVDSPLVHYCSAKCSGDGDCPRAMRCDDGACRYAPPSPGALGAPCGANGDCAGSLCATDSASGARTCSALCVATATSPCANGFTCAAIAGATTTGCFPSPTSSPIAAHGGCAIASYGETSASRSILAAMAAALFALTRAIARRRARSIARPSW